MIVGGLLAAQVYEAEVAVSSLLAPLFRGGGPPLRLLQHDARRAGLIKILNSSILRGAVLFRSQMSGF